MDSSDCVIPVENQALENICSQVQLAMNSTSSTAMKGSGVSDGARIAHRKLCRIRNGDILQPFDDMNNIVANFLINMTRYIREIKRKPYDLFLCLH